MDYQALKKIGNEMLSEMIRDAVARGDFGKRDRGETARDVIERLGARVLSADEKRFIGNYIMAQCGYGGGL